MFFLPSPIGKAYLPSFWGKAEESFGSVDFCGLYLTVIRTQRSVAFIFLLIFVRIYIKTLYLFLILRYLLTR